MEKTAIIGIGNILLQDDGVGVHIIHMLQTKPFPTEVTLVDGGTATLDMLGYFLDYNRVIVVDCLKAGHAPGTVYKIRPEEISRFPSENLSLHDVLIIDVVRMAQLFGKSPDVIIFGIEPETIAMNLGMSKSVEEKIPEVVRLIEKELTLSNEEVVANV